MGVLAAAFLSHFSTLSVGVPLVGLIASALVVGGRPTVRWKGVWIGLVCVAAVGVSYAAYYRHFHHVYQQTVERVMSHETVETPGSSIAASPMVKLQRWATGGSDDYGLPGVPLAAATILGFVWIVRQRMREPWTLILAAWLATWLGFTALGILSSVQMRVNLAGAPMFVCLGAYALAGLSASSSPARRVAAAALAVVIAFDGARLWWMCLGH